ETPLNRIHLNNMVRADQAGAIICPPMPAFYHHPASFIDVARDYVMRVASLLGIEVMSMRRWDGIELRQKSV
ncbi:MAG: aromatic acid decarboxylase, partial [Desulfobulbaceae bacterium]|nr:aromatic acid decarboxylase [Desulfobulbaceae bacterium]